MIITKKLITSNVDESHNAFFNKNASNVTVLMQINGKNSNIFKIPAKTFKNSRNNAN